MATPIGTNVVTSIARRFILPTITDQIYRSNVLLYRLMANNKRTVQGGTQIEVPLLFQRFNNGGSYRGLDPFSTTPSDTIRNAAFDWKQYYTTWSIDGLTMIKVDSPQSIANLLTLQSQQAYMEMAENLATGLFSDGTGNGGKDLDGLLAMFGTANTYGGLSRSTYSWWQPTVQGGSGAATAMTLSGLQTLFGNVTIGGQHPSIILSRQDQYNRYWALNAGGATNYSTQYPRQPMGHDEILASAGFTNLLFNNVPWVVDSHVPDASNINANGLTNSLIMMLNESVLTWAVSPRADFYMKPFVEPHNQDGMVAALMFAGNLICMNSVLQGVIANYTS